MGLLEQKKVKFSGGTERTGVQMKRGGRGLLKMNVTMHWCRRVSFNVNGTLIKRESMGTNCYFCMDTSYKSNFEYFDFNHGHLYTKILI